MHIHDLQLELTSLCCCAIGQDTAPRDQSSARLHHWNTLLFVGLFTAKVTSYPVLLLLLCLHFVRLLRFLKLMHVMPGPIEKNFGDN